MTIPELSLTFSERLILANQFKILALIDLDEAASHKRAIEILRQGFEYEYDSIASHIDREVVTSEQCEEVHEVLEMFEYLAGSYEKLADKSGIDARDVTFDGFDGNNECGQLSYAEFLKENNRYPSINVVNSHGHRLEMYRRMLSEYKRIHRINPLTKEEIQAVVAASVHPSHRQANQ